MREYEKFVQKREISFIHINCNNIYPYNTCLWFHVHVLQANYLCMRLVCYILGHGTRPVCHAIS